jgi:hypothetical protein
VEEVARRAVRRLNGSWARIYLVQADEMELLDGLACADLREVLSADRVRAFAGEDASERLLEELRDRREYSLVSAYLPLLGTRRRAEPDVEGVLARAIDEQAEHERRLLERVTAIYAQRDRRWWARRYRQARDGGPSLRVLVPTCRHSTFIKHSSADLVDALAAAGCRAELLIEPDDSTHFSAGAYLSRVAALEPDLVVLINYTRAHVGECFPKGLPFVTWVQDALAAHLDAKVGAGLGAMDFVVGNLYAELFTLFGYPRERTLHRPVVASTRKFHAGPVAEKLRERFACEIAMVSHQSETPEAIHARLRREAGPDPQTVAILEGLRPRVLAIAADPMAGPINTRLAEEVRAVLRAVTGRDAAEETVAKLVRQYCLPLADRAIRHEALGWAAEVCARRGWRLAVYGRGWEHHPTLAACARGDVAHGEELRACYQCAAAQLHASINTLVHQRVMECALSGGLPLCRLQREAFSDLWWAGRRAALLRGGESFRDPEGRLCFPVADHPELLRAASQSGALGIRCDPHAAVWDRQIAELTRPDASIAAGVHAGWLLGDLSETTFRSAAELERLVERAIDGPEWRRAVSRGIAGRVSARLSHDTLAREIVSLVTAGLEA